MIVDDVGCAIGGNMGVDGLMVWYCGGNMGVDDLIRGLQGRLDG